MKFFHFGATSRLWELENVSRSLHFALSRPIISANWTCLGAERSWRPALITTYRRRSPRHMRPLSSVLSKICEKCKSRRGPHSPKAVKTWAVKAPFLASLMNSQQPPNPFFASRCPAKCESCAVLTMDNPNPFSFPVTHSFMRSVVQAGSQRASPTFSASFLPFRSSPEAVSSDSGLCG